MKSFSLLLSLIITFSAHAETVLDFTGLVLPQKNGVNIDGSIFRRTLVFSEGKIVEDRIRSNQEIDQFLTDLPESFYKNSSYCSLQGVYFLDTVLSSNQLNLNEFSLPASKVCLTQQSFMVESFSQYQKPVENWLDVIKRETVKPLMRVGFNGRLEVVGSPGMRFTVETNIQDGHAKLQFTNLTCSFPFFKNEPNVNDTLIEQLIYSTLGI